MTTERLTLDRRALIKSLGAASLATALPSTEAQGPSPHSVGLPSAPVRDRSEQAPERLLEEEPVLQVSEAGDVTLTWRTVVPTQGGTLYLGVPNDEVALDWPIYNANQAIEEPEPRLEHTAVFDLSRWIGRYQAKLMFTGGVFAYRLELIDPRKPAARFIDRQFQFDVKDSVFRLGLTVVEGPFLALVEEKAITIWWVTDQPSRGEVLLEGNRIVASSGDGSSPSPATRHVVRVDHLEAGRTYRYQVRSTAAATANAPQRSSTTRPASFRTAPREPAFSFVFTCDGRTGGLGGGDTALEGINGLSARMLATQMSRHQPAFLIFTGDLISGYTTREDDFRAQLRSWKRIYGPLWRSVPIYTGMGNHESLLDRHPDGTQTDKVGEASAEAVFASEFVHPMNGPEPRPGRPPYKGAVYSFDFGGCHFVQLNSDYWYSSAPEERPGSPFGRLLDDQLEWFEQDLARARAGRPVHIFVFVHEPAFPNGGHVVDALWEGGEPQGVAARDRFWTALTRAGAVAVFSGHEHNYSRILIDSKTPVHRDLTPNPDFSRPVHQITQGAAGAPFYPQDFTTPWTASVARFVAHTWAYSHIIVKGKQVTLDTYSYTGELLDRAELAS